MPYSVNNNTVSLGNSSKYTVIYVQDPGIFTGMHEIEDPDTLYFYNTLGCISIAANGLFASIATQERNLLQFTGSLAAEYVDYGDYFEPSAGCSAAFRNPSYDVIDALNEMMFRAAAIQAPNTSIYFRAGHGVMVEAGNITLPSNWTLPPVPQVVSMAQTEATTVFHLHYRFLAAALAIIAFSILVVIPTFNGYSTLGRKVSFSPVEIAKAFDAPLFAGNGSDASAKQLLERFGEEDVGYGDVFGGDFEYAVEDVRGSVEQKLQFAGRSHVSVPREGEVYA